MPSFSISMRRLPLPAAIAIEPDKSKTNTHGKIFVLEKDTTGDGKINLDDLEWDYLEGDGDFRSEEVKKLRDEADIIVTNPPFSLFREFLAWIVEADKQFIIIGNINCVTYKEVFPLLKDNKVWMGCTIHSGDREFGVPDEYPLEAAGCRIDENGKKYIGTTTAVIVTSILQTAAGRMIFAKPKK